MVTKPYVGKTRKAKLLRLKEAKTEKLLRRKEHKEAKKARETAVPEYMIALRQYVENGFAAIMVRLDKLEQRRAKKNKVEKKTPPHTPVTLPLSPIVPLPKTAHTKEHTQEKGEEQVATNVFAVMCDAYGNVHVYD